jgi:hypothetical protein
MGGFTVLIKYNLINLGYGDVVPHTYCGQGKIKL